MTDRILMGRIRLCIPCHGDEFRILHPVRAGSGHSNPAGQQFHTQGAAVIVQE